MMNPFPNQNLQRMTFSDAPWNILFFFMTLYSYDVQSIIFSMQNIKINEICHYIHYQNRHRFDHAISDILRHSFFLIKKI